jgi:hypothetical protein
LKGSAAALGWAGFAACCWVYFRWFIHQHHPRDSLSNLTIPTAKKSPELYNHQLPLYNNLCVVSSLFFLLLACYYYTVKTYNNKIQLNCELYWSRFLVLVSTFWRHFLGGFSFKKYYFVQILTFFQFFLCLWKLDTVDS